jgi:hypothetical protein
MIKAIAIVGAAATVLYLSIEVAHPAARPLPPGRSGSHADGERDRERSGRGVSQHDHRRLLPGSP